MTALNLFHSNQGNKCIYEASGPSSSKLLNLMPIHKAWMGIIFLEKRLTLREWNTWLCEHTRNAHVGTRVRGECYKLSTHPELIKNPPTQRKIEVSYAAWVDGTEPTYTWV